MNLDITAHLERVSRSFAFCIARLDEPLRSQVGLAYLLCRILDTVEDARWQNPILQKQAFNDFIAMLTEGDRANVWSSALLLNTQGVSPSERALILETDLVVQAIQGLPIEVRNVLLPPVISMAQGMREFANSRNANGGRLRLPTIADVNHYCFFVAGVVGEILDGLLRVEARKVSITVATKLRDGFRFGLFLQKVNVLKDREADLGEGRDLVPIVFDVFQSALDDAEHAFAYIQAIPSSFKNYRLFCAWSMFLGLASLPHIARGVKIGRLETIGLLAKVEMKIESTSSLAVLFTESLETARMAAARLAPKLGPWKNIEPREADGKEVEKARLALYRAFYVGSAGDEDLIDVASG